MKATYNVTDFLSGNTQEFSTIKKAINYIETWGYENDVSVGKVDIDKKTILWNVGTFKNPIMQFEKINNL